MKVTSAYHSMCNGLVEKFNGTLQNMLRRMCAEKPKNWDRYTGPLLFAYREERWERCQSLIHHLKVAVDIVGPI